MKAKGQIHKSQICHFELESKIICSRDIFFKKKHFNATLKRNMKCIWVSKIIPFSVIKYIREHSDLFDLFESN